MSQSVYMYMTVGAFSSVTASSQHVSMLEQLITDTQIDTQRHRQTLRDIEIDRQRNTSVFTPSLSNKQPVCGPLTRTDYRSSKQKHNGHDTKGKDKGQILAIALLTRVRLKTSSDYNLGSGS